MNKSIIFLNLVILSLIVAFAFVITSYVEVLGEKDIYGAWRGECRGKELMFEFGSDKTCALSFKDKTSGSTETINGNFEMQFSKKPVPLTIRNIPQLGRPLHTIVEFTGNKSIKIAPFADRWRLRPISFDPEASMNLRRDDAASVRK